MGKTNVLKEKFQKLHNSLQHEALRAKVCFFGKVPLHLDPHQTWKKEKSRRAVVWSALALSLHIVPFSL